MCEVGFRQFDRRVRDVYPGYDRAALREPGEIDGGPATDLEHRFAAIAVEINEPQQMVQFFEMILIEIVKESARSNRMAGDREIMNVPLPVGAHFVDGRHADNNIAGARAPLHASRP